jgi:DNA-binding response OmpR family regulator
VRILVVEDDPAIAAAVEAGLTGEGWPTDVVGNGREALAFAAAYPYDVVLLDLVLPGMSGLEVCAGLRAAGVAAPILMVTALDAVEDRVAGLDRGADDYLAKPFAMAELLARIRALRRRHVPDRGPTLRAGDLEIELATRTVSRKGEPVRLTAREFALLEFLARNPGQVFTRDRLIDAVWNADYAPESNVVEVYIRSLRRKIDDGRRNGMIETIRGAGYRLRPGETES